MKALPITNKQLRTLLLPATLFIMLCCISYSLSAQLRPLASQGLSLEQQVRSAENEFDANVQKLTELDMMFLNEAEKEAKAAEIREEMASLAMKLASLYTRMGNVEQTLSWTRAAAYQHKLLGQDARANDLYKQAVDYWEILFQQIPQGQEVQALAFLRILLDIFGHYSHDDDWKKDMQAYYDFWKEAMFDELKKQVQKNEKAFRENKLSLEVYLEKLWELERAIRVYPEYEDFIDYLLQKMAEALEHMATQYASEGKHGKAAEAYNEAMEKYEETGNSEKQAEMHEKWQQAVANDADNIDDPVIIPPNDGGLRNPLDDDKDEDGLPEDEEDISVPAVEAWLSISLELPQSKRANAFLPQTLLASGNWAEKWTQQNPETVLLPATEITFSPNSLCQAAVSVAIRLRPDWQASIEIGGFKQAITGNIAVSLMGMPGSTGSTTGFTQQDIIEVRNTLGGFRLGSEIKYYPEAPIPLFIGARAGIVHSRAGNATLTLGTQELTLQSRYTSTQPYVGVNLGAVLLQYNQYKLGLSLRTHAERLPGQGWKLFSGMGISIGLNAQ